LSETICALATPAGGAIGIIRMSGDKTFKIIEGLLKTRSGKPFVYATSKKRFYGDLYSLDGELIDDVVVNFYPAPHSYTGEDCAEVSCHGSSYILQQALSALIAAGCRQAQPGEYTKRAYLNGRMDLSQAEAVADLISASNKATHKIALGQLRGHISNALAQLREKLLKLNSLLELELDFSDHEELEFADRKELLTLAEELQQRIEKLANSFAAGKAIKEGIAVAIVGKPNVGKSTLLNRLLREDRAIVSNISGTTRDTIEDTTTIHGITFRFIDTAGLRHTTDEIEKMGIERTYKKLSEAAIVIWLLDQAPSSEEENRMRSLTEEKKLIKVFNKSDLHPDTDIPKEDGIIRMSAKYDSNLDVLEEQLYQAAGIPDITENDVIVTNARHYDALFRADESIGRVLDGLQSGLSSDLVSEDLRICLEQLAEITGGAITPQETLNNIFQHFCIGK
jgi:tRNA modification GTPase